MGNRDIGKDRRFLVRYTVMFICAAMIVLLPLIHSGKTIIKGYDGVYQHYSALMYLGDYIRSGIAGQGWKMVDLSIGEGLDVLMTLGYYCFLEPLALLTAWVPSEFAEIAYQGLLIARMYLAGLFACMLMCEFEAKGWASAIGGVMYAFCGFAIIGAMRHLNFGIGYMFLPLLILSIERFFRGKGWVLYVVTVALMLISNYYFAYMNTVIAILYIAILLILDLFEQPVKVCAKKGFGLLAGYLLGAALSAVIFLPTISSFLTNTRVGVESGYDGSMLGYGIGYYKELLLAAFGVPGGLSHWVTLGYIPLSAFGLVALYVDRKRSARQVRIFLPVLLIMLCIPFVGKIMNGFGYVCNRWAYAAALFVSLATAMVLPRLLEDGGKWKLCTAVLGLIWAVVHVATDRKLPSVFVLTSFAAVGLIVCAERLPVKFRFTQKTQIRILCLAVVGIVGTYGAFYFVSEGEGGSKSCKKAGVYRRYVQDEMTWIRDNGDEGFYRVARGLDRAGKIEYQDAFASELGYNGVSFYWSLVPSTIGDHYIDLYTNTLVTAYKLLGQGGAADTNLLSAVKYYIRYRDGVDVVPHGLEKVGVSQDYKGDPYDVYEYKNALPLGYVYDEAMSWEEYRSLDAAAKRDALLEKAVVRSGTVKTEWLDYHGFTEKETVRLENMGVDERIRFTNGSSIIGNVPVRSEVYVMFDGMKIDFSDNGQNYGAYYVQGDQGANYVSVVKSGSNFAYEQKGVNVYMGVFEPGEYRFEVICEKSEMFSCEEIALYCRPVEDYETSAAKLGQRTLQDINIGTNRIEGTVSLDAPGYLQVAVPWQKGWRACVDGKDAELYISGGMYMGLELEKGEHSIVLEYETPLIKEGFLISVVALIVF